MPEHNSLISHLHLRPLGRRLRLRDGQQLAVRSLWLPLLAAALIQLLGRLLPWSGYSWLSWTPLFLWLLVVPGYGLLRPLPPAHVARRADAELNLRDRLATALELDVAPFPAREARFDPALVAQQKADALDVAQSLDVRRAFPLRWPRRPLAMAAGCLIAVLLLTLLPNPMDAILAERAAIAAAAEEQAERLEQLAEELAADKDLDPTDREDLLRQLRELTERLRDNPGDRERALVDLAQLEEALRRQLDPQHAARQAALEGLAADLVSLANAADRDPSLDEAARLLEQLAEQAAEMSPQEREALASALEEAAGRLAGSDADLAGALSQMAQALRGDGESGAPSGQPASLDARAAVQALRVAASDAALQQALAQALNQTQGAAANIAQASQSAPAQNSGQAQGQGQGQGQGRGQGQGQIGGGGGTTARTGPPGTRPGRAGDPTDPNKPFDVGESDTIFAPWQQGQPGEPDFVPGRQSEQGQDTTREGAQPQPGAPGAAVVPYAQVFASYAAAAAQTMEREYVPLGLKDYVRDYFTLLEP